MKTEYIGLRITAQEKEKLKLKAKEKGFDTISAFLLWIIRKKTK